MVTPWAAYDFSENVGLYPEKIALCQGRRRDVSPSCRNSLSAFERFPGLGPQGW